MTKTFFARLTDTYATLINQVSGMGTASDIARTTVINTRNLTLTEREVFSLYSRSGVIQTIIERIPELSLEAEFTFTSPNDADTSKLQQFLFKTLDLKNKLYAASISARLFRESYLLIDTGEETTELKNPISPGSEILDIVMFELGELTPVFQNQIRAFYRASINSNLKIKQSLEIHPSRIIVVSGKETTDKIKKLNGGFALSTLSGIVDSYTSTMSAHNTTQNILARLVTFIFKLGNLTELASELEANVQERLRIHSQSLGSTGGIAIDTTEGAEWVQASLSGVPETLTKFERVFTANATELTHDIIWNEGSHSTSSDLEFTNVQRAIKSFLTKHWLPIIQQLTDLVADTLYPGVEITVGFQLPAPTLTIQDAVIVDKTRAETEAIRLTNGVTTVEEIQQERVTDIANKIIKVQSVNPHTLLESRLNSVGDFSKIMDVKLERPQEYIVTSESLEGILFRVKNMSGVIEELVFAELETEADNE